MFYFISKTQFIIKIHQIFMILKITILKRILYLNILMKPEAKKFN